MKTSLPLIKIKSTKKISKAEIKVISDAYISNKKYFNFDLPHLNVVSSHSSDEWRIQSKYYYFEFARGLVLRDGTVVVKNKKLAKKSSAAWGKILTHEINHSYWCELRKKNQNRRELWSPIWLAEGMACFVAKNDFILPLQKLKKISTHQQFSKTSLPYRYSSSLFKSAEDIIILYSLWTNFFIYLSKRGLTKTKLINLISKNASKSSFDRNFKNLMGQLPNEVYFDYLKTLIA